MEISVGTLSKLDMTPEQSDVIGDAVVITITAELVTDAGRTPLNGDDQVAAEDKGTTRVTVPFQPAQGKTVADYDIWYVATDGSCELITDWQYEDGLLTFATTHYSAFAVMDKFTITASAGSNGSVSPSSTKVSLGGSASFTVTANTGYEIDDVTVDGNSVGAVSKYTFTDVNADHTIAASFKAVQGGGSGDSGDSGSGDSGDSGSGGSSGSGSVVVPEKPAKPIDEVKDMAAKDGSLSSANVKDVIDAIAAAIEADKDFVPEITVDSSTTDSLTLPARLVKALADSNGTVEVFLANATIAIPVGILEGTIGDLTVNAMAADVPEQYKDEVKDRPVYEFSMTSGTAKVAFDGKVRVSVPYILADGETAANLYVAYLGDAIEEFACTYGGGLVVFETTHFSPYAVMHKAVVDDPVEPDPVDPVEPDESSSGKDDTLLYAAIGAIVIAIIAGIAVAITKRH